MTNVLVHFFCPLAGLPWLIKVAVIALTPLMGSLALGVVSMQHHMKALNAIFRHVIQRALSVMRYASVLLHTPAHLQADPVTSSSLGG